MRVVLSDPLVQGGNVVVARVTPVLIDVRVAQAPGDGLRYVERLLHFSLVQPVGYVVVLALQIRDFLGGRVEPKVVGECVLLRKRPPGKFGEGQDGVGGAGGEVYALNEDVLIRCHDGVSQVLTHVRVGTARVGHAGALPCSPVCVSEQRVSVEGGHDAVALFSGVSVGIAQKETLEVERRVLLGFELIQDQFSEGGNLVPALGLGRDLELVVLLLGVVGEEDLKESEIVMCCQFVSLGKGCLVVL